MLSKEIEGNTENNSVVDMLLSADTSVIEKIKSKIEEIRFNLKLRQFVDTHR